MTLDPYGSCSSRSTPEASLSWTFRGLGLGAVLAGRLDPSTLCWDSSVQAEGESTARLPWARKTRPHRESDPNFSDGNVLGQRSAHHSHRVGPATSHCHSTPGAATVRVLCRHFPESLQTSGGPCTSELRFPDTALVSSCPGPLQGGDRARDGPGEPDTKAMTTGSRGCGCHGLFSRPSITGHQQVVTGHSQSSPGTHRHHLVPGGHRCPKPKAPQLLPEQSLGRSSVCTHCKF